jgi:hypothetical protein
MRARRRFTLVHARAQTLHLGEQLAHLVAIGHGPGLRRRRDCADAGDSDEKETLPGEVCGLSLGHAREVSVPTTRISQCQTDASRVSARFPFRYSLIERDFGVASDFSEIGRTSGAGAAFTAGAVLG